VGVARRVDNVYDITGWSAVADLKSKRYYIDVPRLLGPYFIDLCKPHGMRVRQGFCMHMVRIPK